MNTHFNKIRELPFKKKIQFIAAAFLTASLMVALPVYAWFVNQKKAAEMYKIEYPNSLYLNAAHREDRMYFNLDELDMEEYFTGDDGLPINYSENGDTPEYRRKTHSFICVLGIRRGNDKFYFAIGSYK